MNVLVTGTQGQLAQSLKRQMHGHENLSLNFFGRPELELENPDNIVSLIQSEKPDVIINAAAYTAVDNAEDETEIAQAINGIAPGIIASTAADIGAKIIHISTDYVFNGEQSHPYKETDFTGPTSVYGQTKLDGEQAVRAANPHHAIIRTAWIYSPFGNNFVKTMLRLAAERDELSVVHDQIGNPTSALDIADGILAMVSHWRGGEQTGLGETFHLSGTGIASWAEFAEAIFDANKKKGGAYCVVKKITSAEYPTKAKRPKNSALDCKKFQDAFGYTAPRWQDSLLKVMQASSF
ncbi:MAG: dTDP-4-dehydrorhamnose reductase [Hyphomicrobiales bacterium]